jgi:nicotinate-nucleotide pyrophosphorylase (carboxylating)
VIAGLPVAGRVFHLLDSETTFEPQVLEGEIVEKGQTLAQVTGPYTTLLMGERVALNLAMRLSGIATLTRKYVETIADLPTRVVDTRKTTPGLRILEKYASLVGGAMNHRLGLDDSVMIKDNHILAAGGIVEAVRSIRRSLPYPLTIEVETSNFQDIQAAIAAQVDIIMLDNMEREEMAKAVQTIRRENPDIRIEASGNITLDSLRLVAKTGVDFISTSAPITRSPWLDLSMRILPASWGQEAEAG